MRRPRVDSTTGASILVYVVLLASALFEQIGRTTNDTKTPLIEQPATFLHQALTLWNPLTNFGELQNQAYGYLFPQGPFFLLSHMAGVAPWVAERVWSVLIVVVAAEGLRLVARSIGMGPWAAWIAGMSYGLSPRILAQVAVRSAEVLPTAVLPWMVLPVVLAITGRLAPRRAALFSAAAFMFAGAVNGTATVAGLPLVVVLLVWGARRRLIPWSMLGWWGLAVAATSYWWTSALLRLNTYSPPFFDYVEDARATTETSGYAPAIRGLSNWVNYTFMGNQPAWPAGYDYAYQPVLVLASGILAAVGVVGLIWLPKAWRAPMVVAACLGLFCITVGHLSVAQSPLAPVVQHLLDGPFALLRNISKADLMLRLPICLGIGAVFTRLVAQPRRHRRKRRTTTGLMVAALVGLVLGMAQPAVAMNLRTPGWKTVPKYWSQVADYLDKAPGQQRAWVVPGTGFGLQTWGWTMDEPLQAVAKTPWVSRSQVPLTPPQTIRTLSSLERFLESGSGSSNLGPALGRLGIGYVLVRHDLDELASDTTTSNLVSIALARSRGIERVATFGAVELGPAIELYRVTSSDVAPELVVRPLDEAVTVASASSDVVSSVTEGLLSPHQPAVVQGDDGWDRPADIVGDTYRDRERNFGRVHDGEGPVRARGEPRRAHRVVPDYPANEASRPVRAEYDGGALATASSSQGWTNGLGRVEPQSAPYAAVDGDLGTGWRSAFYQRPQQQWWETRWPSAHEIGRVQIRTPVNDGQSADVKRWRVTAGKTSVTAVVDPFRGLATADLRGVRSDHLRIAVDGVRPGPWSTVSILEVTSDVTPYQRTLKLPPLAMAPEPSFVFTAQPETRACISTLLGPDCSQDRKAASEESTGIDRTFRVDRTGAWTLSGTVMARSTPGTVALLNPLGSHVVLHSSSQWLSDPALSVRLAYDGSTTTSWIADPRNGDPTVTVDFDHPQLIDRIAVSAPAPPAITPTTAVIKTGTTTRTVQLGEFGQFSPLRTNHLSITFSNPHRGLAPIGISELYLPPARVATPLKGDDVTGAVCGFGPVLHIDGQTYETAVRGFIGDVVSAGPLHYESCSGPVRLGPGAHRFRLDSTQQFQPVSALLRSPARYPTSAARTLSRSRGPVTHQFVTVGAGPASMLSTTRNLNSGWKATLDGKSLEPMISDGWAQAWRVPAGNGGRLEITYAPQRPYLISLYGGLGLAAMVLVAAVLVLLRTRLRPLRPFPERASSEPSLRRWLVILAIALPMAWVLGGLPALVGVALGAVAAVSGRCDLARIAGGACLVVAYTWAAWTLRSGPHLRIDATDVLAGIGFALVLTSLVPRPSRRLARPRT